MISELQASVVYLPHVAIFVNPLARSRGSCLQATIGLALCVHECHTVVSYIIGKSNERSFCAINIDMVFFSSFCVSSVWKCKFFQISPKSLKNPSHGHKNIPIYRQEPCDSTWAIFSRVLCNRITVQRTERRGSSTRLKNVVCVDATLSRGGTFEGYFYQHIPALWRQ